MALFGSFLRHVLITLAGVFLLGAVAAAMVVPGGLYDVAAFHQHTRPVYELLHIALRRSVEVHAAAISAPPVADARLVESGFRIYRDQCVQCHGAPGVPRHPLGQGMQPLPTNLVETAREESPQFIYWVVANGIRMTGMPAWEFRLSERELRAVVAFVEKLPELPPAGYAEFEKRLAAPASLISGTMVGGS